MNEGETMRELDAPVTVDTLVRDLHALGVERGMTLVVHSSLRAIGWVSGGAQAVVLALQATLGDEGTLVMPTHSTHLSDPAAWQNPPLPDASWHETVRATMPAYDPQLTPTRAMGAIVDCFRSQRDALRSGHPQYSFAARGPHAARITANHELANGLGEDAPLARVYDLGGWVLLLGVPHSNSTSLHLAEWRSGTGSHQRGGAPILVDGRRRWVTFDDFDGDADAFDAIGADFARDTGLERVGSVGKATARLMPQRALVDYGSEWLKRRA